jgi:WXG100 family type VII secretion target
MAAGELQISFEDLRALGQALIAKADEYQTQHTALHAAAQPDQIWRGSAADAYKAEFDKWSAAFTTMINSLRDMGGFLQRAATAYEDVNRNVMVAMGLGE